MMMKKLVGMRDLKRKEKGGHYGKKSYSYT
jgi:hypothetical protein